MAEINSKDIVEISEYNPNVLEDEPWQNESSGGTGFLDAGVGLVKGVHSLATTVGDLGLAGISGAINSKRNAMVESGELPDSSGYVDANKRMREEGFFNPEAGSAALDHLYSKDMREAAQKVDAAEGFWNTFSAYLENPRAIEKLVAESIPQMIPIFREARSAYIYSRASGLAKGLAGKELDSYVKNRVMLASGATEGSLSALSASQAIGQHNLENGKHYNENQQWAIPIGVTTGVIGQLNPMEANIMSRGLVKGLLAREAIATGKPTSMLKSVTAPVGRLAGSMIKEGPVEEGAQGFFETGFTNVGQEKDFMEGQGKAFAENAIAGAAMGAAMHPFTGPRRKGSVEDAINNQGEPPADQTAQPQQAIDPNQVGTATPGQTMTPANQTQVAQAASQVPDPNQAAQTPPAQAVATAPGAPLTTQQKYEQALQKKAEEDRLKAEEAARIDQEERAKYGEDFLARHADTFHKQTKGLSEDEKTLVFNTYEAQGILGNVNAPSRNRVDEALRAYKYSNGDKAKTAERFRGWAREAENSGAKNAVETADYYDAMADILEGQDAKKNLEFKRQQREQAIQQAKDAEAKAQAEAQAQAQAQQTKEGKTEAVEIPSTQEPKTAPLEVTQLPTEQELATDWQKGTEKEYLDHINAQVDRLSKGGKITPEQAEAVYETWNKKGKVGKKAAFGNAIKKLRSIEFPPKPKEPAKPTRKTLTEESKLTWDSQGVLDKEARQTLGYTDVEAEQLQRIRALFLSGEVVPNHKQFERLNNLILSGDTKGAKEQAEFMLQRSDALKVNAFIKDDDSLDEDSVKEFKRLLDSQQYKQALELAFKPTDEGGLGLNREDALSVDPEEATRASGNSEASEEQKIAKDNGAEGEDQEAGDFKNSVQEAESENIGESGSDLGKGGKEAKNGTEKAGKKMAAAHSARVIKEEKERSKESIKITKGSDLKEEITKTVEEKKGPVDFSAKLNNLGKTSPNSISKPKLSKAAPRKLTQQEQKNIKDVRTNLNRTWGGQTTHQLVSSGKVVICGSNEDFIDRMAEDLSKAFTVHTKEEIKKSLVEQGFDKGVEGIYWGVTGRVYLNGEVIEKGDVGAVLAHELAVHAIKDDPDFRDLVLKLEERIQTLLKDGIKSKNVAERAFWQRVLERMNIGGHITDAEYDAIQNGTLSIEDALKRLDEDGRNELLAYFMTEYSRKHGIPRQGKLKDIIELIDILRSKLMSVLGVSHLREKDVANLLTSAARVLAKDSLIKSPAVVSKNGKLMPSRLFSMNTANNASSQNPQSPRNRALVQEDAARGVPGALELLKYFEESERDREKRKGAYEQSFSEFKQGKNNQPKFYAVPSIERDEPGRGTGPERSGEESSRVSRVQQGVRGVSEKNLRPENLQNAEVVPDPTVPVDLSSLGGHASRRTKKPQTATEKELKKLEKQLKKEAEQQAAQEGLKQQLKKLEKQLKKEAEQQAAQEGLKQQPGAEQAQAGTILEKGIPTVVNERVEAMSPNNPTKPAMQHLATFVRYLGELGKAAKMSLFKFTDSLVKDVEPYIPSAKSWYQAVIDSAKKVNEIRDNGLKIGDAFYKLDKATQEAVNKFLFDSVIKDAWGYVPGNWKNAAGELIGPEAFATSGEMVQRFKALSKEAQNVVMEVHKWNHDIRLQKQELIDTLGKALMGDKYKSKFTEPKSYLPYVPLERTGRYNVVWKSLALKDMEAKRDNLKKAQKDWADYQDSLPEGSPKLDFPDGAMLDEAERQIKIMKKDANHYHVARFDSIGKAQRRMNELNAQHGKDTAQLYDIGNKEHMKSLTSMREVNELASALKASIDDNFYGKVSDGLRSVIDEYVMDAANKKLDNSMRSRLKVAGANEDIMEAFLNRVNSDAHLISNMTYGKTISDAYVQMKDELDAYKGKHGSAPMVNNLVSAFNELEKRHLQMMERKAHTGFDTASELARSGNTFLMLSLSPMFYVQNSLQPWMMTAPMLAGRFGGMKAHNVMLGAYRDYGSIFTKAFKGAETVTQKLKAFGNLTKEIRESALDQDEKDMLLYMERRNLLDLGAQQEFGSFTGDSAWHKKANKVMTSIGVAARGVEILNRFTAALAAYRLQKQKLIQQGISEADAQSVAQEYAADILSSTQGDYSAQNTPSAFNTRVGKLALQFRKFQAIQFNFFTNMVKGSISNANLEEKRIARYSLGYALSTHFAMAGFKGLPAVSALAAIFGGLFGDDDEEPEDWFRRKCNEAGLSKQLVDLLLEGVPSMLGLNLSDRVGAGTMASITPYTRKDFNKEGGLKEFLLNIAGAPVGTALRIHDGWTQSSWEKNSWRPFIEATLPKGIPGLFKAVGILDPTTDRRTGAKFLKDEDIGITDRALLGLGATPKVLEDTYRMRGQLRRTQEWGTQQSGEIKARFINARRDNNWKKVSEIYKELDELNAKRREKGLPKIKRSDLHSAYKQRLKEEKSMQQYGGMKVPQSQRRLAERIYNVNH